MMLLKKDLKAGFKIMKKNMSKVPLIEIPLCLKL